MITYECFDSVEAAADFKRTITCKKCFSKITYELEDLLFSKKISYSMLIECPCCNDLQYASLFTDEEQKICDKYYNMSREAQLGNEDVNSPAAREIEQEYNRIQKLKSVRERAWDIQYAQTNTIGKEEVVSQKPVEPWWKFW